MDTLSLANSGICCEEAANALIADTVGEDDIGALVRDISGFDRNWLTVSGAEELGKARREAIVEALPGNQSKRLMNLCAFAAYLAATMDKMATAIPAGTSTK